MSPRELEKLLGGYAAGTLTSRERDALFEAAVDDQKLFEALADEEALRELLSDPATRQELLDVLAEPAPGATFFDWLRRPLGMVSVAATAAATVALVFLLRPAPEQEQQVAMFTQSKPEEAAQPPRPSPGGSRVAEKRAEEPVTATVPPEPPAAPAPPEPAAEVENKAKLTAAGEAPARKDEAVASPIRVAVERRLADGSWARTDPSVTFARGDRVRFIVASANPGTILLRSGDAPVYSAAIRPGAEITSPEVTLDAQSGESRFTLELGAAPQPAGLTMSRMRGYANEARDQLPARTAITLRYR